MIYTKDKKKGFTIVELVIVIAVIGILSAVLIPTFSGLVSDAKEQSKQTTLRNAYVEYVSKNTATGTYLANSDIYFCYDGELYKFENNKYVLLKTDENEIVTSTNAVENGFTLLGYKCNGLDAYYKAENKNTEPDNNTPDLEPSDELQQELNQAWEEAKLIFGEESKEFVMFAKESSESGNYDVYSYENTKYVKFSTQTREDLEGTYTFYEDLYNGFYVVM